MNNIPHALVLTWIELAYQRDSKEISNMATKKILLQFGSFDEAEKYLENVDVVNTLCHR
jgi:hypothetical protein